MRVTFFKGSVHQKRISIFKLENMSIKTFLVCFTLPLMTFCNTVWTKKFMRQSLDSTRLYFVILVLRIKIDLTRNANTVKRNQKHEMYHNNLKTTKNK